MARDIHQPQQVGQGPPQAIKLPDHKHIARLQSAQCRPQSRTVAIASGALFFEETLAACALQRKPLKVEVLVFRGDPAPG